MSDDLSQDQSEDRLLGQVADEFLAAVSRGESPSVKDYAKRYPTIAPLIELALPAVAMLNGSAVEKESHDAGKLPDTLGDYRLLREIGRGGMGVVYEAEQISMGRKVALKILPLTAILDGSRLERFHSEVRAAATLDHPHCVPIYAVGEDHGVHYYAMKLIPGQTLAEVIDELKKKDRQTGQPQRQSSANGSAAACPSDSLSISRNSNSQEPFRQIAKLGIQIADALDHAHERGIVHRDIKPSNLMLDTNGSIWITDFGLARIETDASLTTTGDMLGTLRYMSPEQALGKRALVNHRTDIYSLGITLYELLALRPAMEGEDRAKILSDFAENEPTRLSKWVPSIPIDLATIIGKAIEKKPSDRYVTAQELADDLGRYLRHEPIFAKRSTPIERTIKWGRRHPTVTSLISFSLLALASVVGLSLRHASELGHLNVELKQSLSDSEQARHEVVEHQSLLKHHLYTADMQIAHQAWEDVDLRRCENLLLKHLPKDGETPPGIEWRFLWRLSHPPVKTIDKFDFALNALAFTPQGDVYVVAGEESVLRFYNAASDLLIDQFPTDQVEINSINFSPDGQHLATTGDDGTVKIWDWVEHVLQKEFQAIPGKAYGANYLPDGKSLVTWGTAPSIYRWDLEKAKRSGAYAGDNTQTENVAISSDGKLIFAGGDSQKLLTLRTQTMTPIHVVGVSSRVDCIAYANKKKLVLVGEMGGLVTAWHVGESEAAFKIKIADSIECLAIDSQERYVALGGLDGIIHVCRLDNPSKVIAIPAHETHVHSIRFDPKKPRLISCGRDGQIKSFGYDFSYSKYSHEMKAVASSSLSVVGEKQVVGFESGDPENRRMYLLDIDHLEQVAWEFSHSDFGSLRPASGSTQTSRHLATFASGDKPIAYLLDAKTGKLIHQWPLEDDLHQIAVSDQTHLVAAASIKCKILLFDAESKKKLHEFVYPYTDIAPEVCFSPNGKLLACSILNKIHLIDVATKETLQTLDSRGRGINVLGFSLDGSHVACSDRFGKVIRVWNIKTGEQIAELTGHKHKISNLQFLSNNRLLSNDRKGFAVWDLKTQQQYFYHSVGKLPHDIFAGVHREHQINWNTAIHCASAVVLPKEDWLALTPHPGSPQFLKLDVSDVWPLR